MDTVSFSVGKAVRRGKLFETGLYPNQKFPYGPDEMKKTLENTKLPVPIVIEHLDTKKIPTLFDGKLGHIVRLIPSADYSTFSGISEWPEWLEEALKDVDKTVSCTFNRSTYALESVSLTASPVVTDAALTDKLVAAFSKYAESGDEMTVEEIKATVKDAVQDLFKQHKTEPAPEPKVEPKTEDPRIAEMEAKFSKLETDAKNAQAEMERVKAERINDRAVAFAESVRDKLRPTATQDVTAVFSNLVLQAKVALQDDEKGFVTFSNAEGKEESVSRFDMLKASYEALPPVDAGQELIGAALFSEPNTAEFAKKVDDEVENILSYGPYSGLAKREGK